MVTLMSSRRSSRGAFCYACSGNFSLIQETAGMHPRSLEFTKKKMEIGAKMAFGNFGYYPLVA